MERINRFWVLKSILNLNDSPQNETIVKFLQPLHIKIQSRIDVSVRVLSEQKYQ